jgi:hypothetical protein
MAKKVAAKPAVAAPRQKPSVLVDKVMLDQIFGENNFVNEIIWKRTRAHNDFNQAGVK